MLCDVIIPCRDEATALPVVLAGLPAGLRPLVVDNGSSDGTADVARGLGARVVSESRPGYGAAVAAGLAAVEQDLVAVVDGDGTLDLAMLSVLVEAVGSGRCDLAVSRRRPTTRRAMPLPARCCNRLAVTALRRYGVRVHDIGSMRVARTTALRDLAVQDLRFGYPIELLRKAGESGWRIEEFDVAYSCRHPGTRSKVSGSLRGGALALTDFTRALL